MRISHEDVKNKAFEETTMKNMPIDQFWSFKRRNGAQIGIYAKLSKIGPVENFDFWSKVNAKVEVNRSKSKSTATWFGSVLGFWVKLRIDSDVILMMWH